ncbi:MAG: hypothetical protein A2W61_00755 [Deltaproteobacteria bacterium RIFCSPLOWO2_01_44_7]|nr:MAG: hypothetical protein A2712_05810 [Deltaproteobacteria bacterium RIFCSPHIGHO2_01_FULL_43_49]OGQ16646.1 MAG: hypothetical protein A3D22_06935 [Deltaproteobacteria bacterium RIFCSPHIGHO2_02_FULL_44_53]OGQ29784.1 MAG: hypothetical protein A3D98_09600 [Deltaproteobacteria bacterium RIFCSPHIGHO2_12_FULL_44_21]OGQ33074.1 MAG: hypothetical protein A2979_03580 [Deltaproteobacteria bacterium RIFCSPLOWO2_01_FULL_45_74]OGQ37937.1 MAG: hypothetical protein A2W61_00755 [Deltaproteobacteria bacterium 
MLKVLLAFLKRDFLLYFSYRFVFFSNVITVLAFAGTFYYIDRLFGIRFVEALKPFGGDYFSYVLVGIALQSFVGGSLGNLSIHLRQEQLMGTLEAILATPARESAILFSMNIWNFLSASLDMVLYILAGIFVFNVSFAQVNWFSFLTVLALTVISFLGLGTLTACATLIFKGGTSIAGNLNMLCDFLGGVYFPVSVLPWWLKVVAYGLPITYSIQAANKAIYMNASLAEIQREVIILALFAISLTLISLRSFNFALKQAKRYGNLSHY